MPAAKKKPIAKKAKVSAKPAKSISAVRKLTVEDLNPDYLKTGRKLKGSEESQMFGKPCFKVNGKAFMSLFDGCVVFKLTGKTHEAAMKLKGSKLFDPSGTGRAMKEWVQVTMENKSKFDDLAKEAMNYVKALTK